MHLGQELVVQTLLKVVPLEMDTCPLPDEELGTSQVLWSPDLEARWRQLRRHITPFERDRVAYHSAKYQKPVFVFMNPVAWRRLVEKQGAYRSVDLMLMLGFAPAPEAPVNIAEWVEREAAAASLRGLTAGAITACGSGSGGGVAPGRRSFAVPLGPGEELRSGGGVRFWVLNHEDTRSSISGSPVSQYMLPRPVAFGLRASSPAGLAAPYTQVSAAMSSVIGMRPDADGAAARIRNLEAEVKELTRQIRILKSRESERDVSVASDVASQHEMPQPHIVCSDRLFIASTNCHALVCLPVNYLDPDCAPYVVSLGTSTGRTLLACTIVEHRYVFFVAPPRRRGSLPVVLLCTREGTLRPYAKAVWLEYKPQDPPNTLTHHAVNQLLQEIPLPSSSTAVEPNPSEMEQVKSESGFEDDNTFCDTDTAVSTSDHGLEAEPRLPLTKEMLELIPNGVITGLCERRVTAEGCAHANDGTPSGGGSESSLGGVEREDPAPAVRLWNGHREKKHNSTTMSTGHPTSYQRGQQSGYSDEETTQHAYNCTTNRTELSSSTVTSVTSLDSAAPGGVPASVSIMACRGWVRRRLLHGTPASSHRRSIAARTNSFSATVTVSDDQINSGELPPSQTRRSSAASR